MSPTTTPPSCNPTTSPTTTTNTTLLIPVSDSISIPLPVTLPKCLFKSKMRIPKRPVSFCLSLFSSPQLPSLHFSSGITRFYSGILDSPTFRQSPSKRKGIRTEGVNQLHARFTMNGTSVDNNMSQLHSSTCGDGGQDRCIWSSPEGGSRIHIRKQIFCNRSLNMKNIVAVGFDMDYTLAQYKPETFESLAYEGTVKKLVYDLGYPQEMDRHKYVKVAYHGFKEMSKEDKVATYGNTLIRDAFDEPHYALIDTLFSLAGAYLFAQLVDFTDSNPGLVPEGSE